MQRFLFLVLVCLSSISLRAQTEIDSLPSHKGALVLNLDGLHVTQRSAKPQGNEIGVRAHDAAHTELLTFLFLTPNHKHQTASTCLEQDIEQVTKGNARLNQQLNSFGKDDKNSAYVLLTYPNGGQAVYKYSGNGDQCLLIEVYADQGSKLDLNLAGDLLVRQRYDPNYVPTPEDAAKYQSIRGAAILSKTTVPDNTPTMLVGWYTPGGIPLPNNADWKLESLTAYNNAGRPAAQFRNGKAGVIASFIISENVSGKPTSEGCRDDVINGIHKDQGQILSNETEGQMSDGHGGTYPTASHLTLLADHRHNHDVFAFAANKKTCAEIHLSTVDGKPDEEKRLADALALFHPDLTFVPSCTNYIAEANAFYKQSPMMAGPFYDACLHTIPSDTKDSALIATRRIATDRIVIALGSSGKLDQSRAYAQRAIKLDPDYPINYYNLACADAEEGKIKEAQLHLQQAFDRRANVIPGETFPDPTKDDSLLKLRSNKEFWAFVQNLH